MRQQTIGVELEHTGITRKASAEAIAKVLGTTPQPINHRSYEVRDNQGRFWKVINDASVRVESGEACELVTPILTWDDIETLQTIVRELRATGAKVNEKCGLHVHIGAQGMTATAVRNLVNNVASHEEILFKALAVHEDRKRYCKPISERFLRELNERKPASLDELGKIWYQRDTFPTYHYHESRYQTLNLHALFTKGTVEFRLFNATLHAGEIKTAVQLACALVANARAAKHTLYRPVQTENERFAIRTWLIRMGMNGDEFKTARHHLMKNLTGNAAWRHAV